MKLILALTLAQTFSYDTLPNKSLLMASLRTFHLQKVNAAIQEFSAAEKYRWMKWMPTFGLRATQADVRPTVGFTFSQVYTNLNLREQTKQKMQSLMLNAAISFKSDSLELESMLKKVDKLNAALLREETVLKMDLEVFDIIKKQYENKEISPTEYLNQKRHFTEREAKISEKRREIDLLEIDTLKAAKY